VSVMVSSLYRALYRRGQCEGTNHYSCALAW